MGRTGRWRGEQRIALVMLAMAVVIVQKSYGLQVPNHLYHLRTW
jgi:hypothetical protein